MNNKSDIFKKSIYKISIILNIILLVLISMNFLVKRSDLNGNNGYSLKNQNQFAGNYQLLGKKIELKKTTYEEICNFDRINDRAEFTLLVLFSIRDCGSCLTSESLIWEKLFHDSLNLIAISIDESKTDALRYRTTYDPSFPVVWLKDERLINEFNKLNGSTMAVLLDSKKRVISVYNSEFENTEKRETFYNFVQYSTE